MKIKESEEKAMIRNKTIKEKLNMINMKNTKKISENAETRMAVHAHTHTHTCLLVNNYSSKLENISKGRTILWNNSMGLSLSAFVSQRWREEPIFE